MDRMADVRFPLHQLMRERWSSLAFDERPVEPDKLGSLLEAARWAPSSFNEQPWSYIVATKDHPEEFQRLLSCLSEGNRRWAENVPVLMLAVAHLYFSHNGQLNRHAFHDVGLANQNLVLQATALGLNVRQMAGFDPELARRLYEIPDEYEPLTSFAIGYPGETADLSAAHQQRELAPRTRKPLDEMVFVGKWNQPAPFVMARQESNPEQPENES